MDYNRPRFGPSRKSRRFLFVLEPPVTAIKASIFPIASSKSLLAAIVGFGCAVNMKFSKRSTISIIFFSFSMICSIKWFAS